MFDIYGNPANHSYHMRKPPPKVRIKLGLFDIKILLERRQYNNEAHYEYVTIQRSSGRTNGSKLSSFEPPERYGVYFLTPDEG